MLNGLLHALSSRALVHVPASYSVQYLKSLLCSERCVRHCRLLSLTLRHEQKLQLGEARFLIKTCYKFIIHMDSFFPLACWKRCAILEYNPSKLSVNLYWSWTTTYLMNKQKQPSNYLMHSISVNRKQIGLKKNYWGQSTVKEQPRNHSHKPLSTSLLVLIALLYTHHTLDTSRPSSTCRRCRHTTLCSCRIHEREPQTEAESALPVALTASWVGAHSGSFERHGPYNTLYLGRSLELAENKM